MPRLAGTVLFCAFLTLPVAAAPLPPAKVGEGLLKVTEIGTEIFNRGDQAGCYRLYQGALLTAWSALEKRPDIQQQIEAGLKMAEQKANYSDKAFALRKVIDDVRAELRSSAMVTKRPLWDRLGGEPAVRTVVKDAIAMAATDPKVNFTRNGRFPVRGPEAVARTEQLLVEFISSKTGGPLNYTGREMKALHQGMQITDEEFNALGAVLVAVLKKHNVPQTEVDELVGLIVSTRADIVEVPAHSTMKKPLWERLGGEPAVTAVIDDFVARAAANPKVNFTRKGTDHEWEANAENVALVKKRLVQLVSVVSGGPMKYQGRSMKDAHRGMKITSAEFDALAGDLKATLDKFKVPEAEQKELLTIIGSTKKDIVEEK